MCLAIPGKVKLIIGNMAVVKYQKEERRVLVGVKGVRRGDWVLVEMGVISKLLSTEEAKMMTDVWEEIYKHRF